MKKRGRGRCVCFEIFAKILLFLLFLSYANSALCGQYIGVSAKVCKFTLVSFHEIIDFPPGGASSSRFLKRVNYRWLGSDEDQSKDGGVALVCSLVMNY